MAGFEGGTPFRNVAKTQNPEAVLSDSDILIVDSHLVDVDGNKVGIDKTTRVLEIIDIHASTLHQGNAFYIKGFLELNDTDTFFVKLATPINTRSIHFSFAIHSTGICTTYFDEDATGGMTGGTPVIPLNHNRNSSNTSLVILTSGVTVADSYVTRLESDKWGADGFKENIGGSGSNVSEYILKADSTYLRTFISGADNNIIQFNAFWSEIIDYV